MKKFKSLDKIIYRHQGCNIWYPSFYQCPHDKYHFIVGEDELIRDDDILPYEGNERLVGTTDEPEEAITLANAELILVSDSRLDLNAGRGTISNYAGIYKDFIVTKNAGHYNYCIPMSKYNPDNLEETRKWILKVKDGKLVKVNK